MSAKQATEIARVKSQPPRYEETAKAVAKAALKELQKNKNNWKPSTN